MNITSIAIDNLIKYYSLSNAAQLANKFEITQGIVSNWKTRNAIGALVDTVYKKDEKALPYIFKYEKETNFSINEVLLNKVEIKASEYGLNLDEYLTHLIIKDLEKQIGLKEIL